MIASKFNGPVPGNSLTSKPGERRWERPPEVNTAEDALVYYMKGFSKPDVIDDLLIALEIGMPVKPMVESMYISNTMKGIHSLDVGLLIAPALEEFIAATAESYDVPFKMTNKDAKSISDAKENERISMLLDAALAKSGADPAEDEGAAMLLQMSEALDAVTEMEAPMEEALEEEGAPMGGEAMEPAMAEETAVEQSPTPVGGGLMARG